MRIHIWVPEYTSAVGGIQTFSRFMVRGLRELFPSAKLDVFSKNDRSLPDPATDPADNFIPLGWWPARLRTGAFALEIVTHAVRDRPTLIVLTHANFAPVAHMMKKALKIPFLAIGHGIEVWDLEPSGLSRALQAASALSAVSEFTRERMAAVLQMPKEKISLLPNTFDADRFYPARQKPHFLLKRYRLRPDQPVILTIARLESAERYKGYDQVLKALLLVRERFPTVHYIIGGRGPDRARLASLIAELGLDASVTLAGYVPEHELRSHYNLCDVFAMPSKGEGFGIVFLEALACGKAVIAGNKDGSVDAVLGGETGVLVDPDNVTEIAGAIVQVLEDGDRAGSGTDGEARRQRTIEAYGYGRFLKALGNLLEPVISSPVSNAATPI